MSSLIGVLVGLGFIVIGSPLAAWYAESQHAAEDFGSVEQVSADTTTDGYVAIEGESTTVDALACPATTGAVATNCLFVETQQEEYKRTEKDQCGTLPSDAEVIRELEQECDADGTNCSRCYRIAEYNWSQMGSNAEYAEFKIGAYTVTPNSSSNLIGTESTTHYAQADRTTKPEVGDQRTNYDYLALDQRLLVAGSASNGRISSAADGKPYVISNLDYNGTLTHLQNQDATMKWILRIASLALMVIGMILLAGPLTYFTNIFRFIPFLGKHLDQGFDAVIGFVAALLGVALWLLVWVTVLLIKNILIILLILAVIGVAVIVLVQRGKKKTSGDTAPPATLAQ